MKNIDDEIREIMERASIMAGTDKPFPDSYVLPVLPDWADNTNKPNNQSDYSEKPYVTFKISNDLKAGKLINGMRLLENMGEDIYIVNGELPRCFIVDEDVDIVKFKMIYNELLTVYKMKKDDIFMYVDEDANVMSDNNRRISFDNTNMNFAEDDVLSYDEDDIRNINKVIDEANKPLYDNPYEKPLHVFDQHKFNSNITIEDITIIAKDFIEDDEYSVSKMVDLNKVLSDNLQQMTNLLRRKDNRKSKYLTYHINRISNIEYTYVEIVEYKISTLNKNINERTNKLISNLKPEYDDYKKDILAYMASCKNIIRNSMVDLINEMAQELFTSVRFEYDNICLLVNNMGGN